jgi:very-short-patch-repair endonuclease
METEDGFCVECSDTTDEDEWSTDEQSTNGHDADGVTIQESTTAEDSEASTEQIDEATQEGGSRTHIIDPSWDSDVDTGRLEGAVEADSQTEAKDGMEESDPLDRKIDSWKEQLLDLTRRSNLVNFSPTKTKSLPLHRADPLALAEQIFNENDLYVRQSASKEEGGKLPDLEDLDSSEVASIRDLEATENTLYNLRLKQRRFLRERGIDSLFLALGTLRWYDTDSSSSELRTPLFLVSVSLEEEANRNPDRHDYTIKSTDSELQINPALRKMLLSERGLALPPDDALDLETLDEAFAFVEEVISGQSRWEIAPEVILGIFDFSKFGLYADLEENREQIKENPIVKAINGDPSALEDTPETPSAEELDERVPPADTYQVLDADSSQQEAIEAAKRGMSFVLQGPPGTGKSQTISNILAEKMAAGETVLFVSEKQAALNVVKNRLEDVGLGRFCLEAHGEKATKKDVLEKLEQELKAEPLAAPADREQVVSNLGETRSALNQYKQRLFYNPPGQEMTPYEAFGIVSKREELPRLDVEFDNPTEYDDGEIETLTNKLAELQAYESQLNQDGSHPWQHTTLDGWRIDTRETVTTGVVNAMEALSEVQTHATRASEVFQTDINTIAAARSAEDVLVLLGDRPKVTIADSHFEEDFYGQRNRIEQFAELGKDLAEARESLLDDYGRSILEEDGSELHGEIASFGLLRYIQPSYRKLKNRILSHAEEGYDPSFSQLQEDMQLLMQVQSLEKEIERYRDMEQTLGPLYEQYDTDWDTVLHYQAWMAELISATVMTPERAKRLLRSLDKSTNSEGSDTVDHEKVATLRSNLDAALAQWTGAREKLADFLNLDAVEPASVIDPSTVDEESQSLEDAEIVVLEEWLEHLHNNVDELQEWVQYTQRRADVEASQAGDFLNAFIESGQPAETIVDSFKRNFYADWLDSVYDQTDLDSFSATEYNSLLDDFRQLDQQQREYAKAEIQHRVTNRRPSIELQHASSTAQHTLRREIQKSRRHMPLRELFDEAGSLISKLKPVFMMSPLSVAQYLKLGSIDFDTVVFDEASQVMPEDAISSLVRGNQVIIAGDSKQLPPTSFFQSDVETAEDVQEDLESILDETATVLPEKRLLWHYRSRTSELIEFSNIKYYNNALRTFPDNNPDVRMGVEFEFVENGLYDRGGSSTNQPEADRVLELIRTHMEERPDKSLGVVAFSSAQAQAIRDTIEEARDTDPELDAFVSEDDPLEGFFVKSLENVQGDERDALIFSVGYGPDASGKVAMNFGPLNQTGGERRLNVAVTRAKELIQIVASIQPSDIDLGRTGARGVEDFKHYLQYAKRGQEALKREDSEPEVLHFDSEFEEAVYTALDKRGFDVATQIQSSGYSIDLAIKHPDKPGKYVLGIECDGAAYHSSKTARDRDRTRQAVLEDLGWTIHRIWSPDWASNKQREIEEIQSKVDKLVSGAVSTDGGASSVEIEEVIAEPLPESQRGGLEAAVSQWEDPQIATSLNKDFEEISLQKRAAAISAVVEEYGPIEQEQLFKTVISRWHIQRLGKKIRSGLNSTTGTLASRGLLHQRDGFIWPEEEPAEVPIRTNAEDVSRSIDEIPLEEIAKAAHIILEAGSEMTKHDLILEVVRLFGYQRRGERITARVGEAVEIVVDMGGATKQTVDDGEVLRYVETDIDDHLLNRIY